MSKTNPAQLKIDHVTIAGSSLAQLENIFADLGLVTDYGGSHSNGITHMSLLGFDDGTYIELISSLEPGRKDTAFWGEHIVGDGGPCAWAVYVDDVASEAARMAQLGVTVDGPHTYHRKRPDGKLLEWDLAFLGNKGAGATLPFIIKDRTPRELRVQPSASVSAHGRQPALLTGVDTVVLGIHDYQETIALFERVYEWSAPQISKDSHFGARLSRFPNSPVILASPLGQDPWLRERLSRFGESPCAYLLGTGNFESACQRFNLHPAPSWFGRQLAWFDPDKLNGHRLGVVS